MEDPNSDAVESVGPADAMGSAALRLVHHRPEGPADAGVRAEDPRSQLRDEELLAVTCAGDRDAFRILVERYEDKAVHTARAIVGSPETAREVVQETFLRVYANRDKFDMRRKFASWFYRILRNQAVDRVRRQSSGTPGAAVELVGDWSNSDKGPVSDASRDERRIAVRRILNDLPRKFRIVLDMRDLQGLSCGEIAERVGTTAGTVRWRLHHARKLFREQWERVLGKEEGDTEL
ncbi:MAG TPA: RNA polymerase sigma factor [Planctomycetota bacterium]